MAYIDPKMVLSPKGKVSELNVIIDKGANEYSVAIMKWEGEDSVGIRWNGADSSVGNPQSRGVATWFVLPEEIAAAYLKSLIGEPSLSTTAEDAIKKYISKIE